MEGCVDELCTYNSSLGDRASEQQHVLVCFKEAKCLLNSATNPFLQGGVVKKLQGVVEQVLILSGQD